MGAQYTEDDHQQDQNAEGEVASLFLVEIVQVVEEAEAGAHKLRVAVVGPLCWVVLISGSL